MTRYRTYKTTMGRRIRVRMTEEEIAARWIYGVVIAATPFAMCWLFALVARMV